LAANAIKAIRGDRIFNGVNYTVLYPSIYADAGAALW
jgi:hypothetical protein